MERKRQLPFRTRAIGLFTIALRFGLCSWGPFMYSHTSVRPSSSPVVVVPNPDRTDTGCVRSGAANFLLKREKADAPEQQIELRRAATPQNRSVPDVSLFYV